jgi:hypothetical protein
MFIVVAMLDFENKKFGARASQPGCRQTKDNFLVKVNEGLGDKL